MSRVRAAVIVAGAALAAYVNALLGTFQFDDFNVIVDDPRVASVATWWMSMPGMRPLLKLSYALNNASGAGVIGFHAINVAIHAGNVVLILVLFWKLAARFVPDARTASHVAVASALVFALHPVQTEAVTYVSGRSASLCALLCLSSMLAWVERRWVSPVLFALALGVKESAAVLPAALLLWDVVERPAGRLRDRAAGIASHVAVVAAAAALFLTLPAYRRFVATSLGLHDLTTTLRTQASAVFYLLGQLVRLDRLNADPALPTVASWSPGSIATVTMAVALVFAAVVALRRQPAIGFGVAWFLVWLAPTCTLLPRLDVANDRQLYLALAGPAWLAGLGAGAILRRRPRVATTCCVAIALALCASTVARNRVYATEIDFWEDVTKKTPSNARAFNNLGYAYALAGRTYEAEGALRHALTLAPGDPKAIINLRMLHDRTEGALPRKVS